MKTTTHKNTSKKMKHIALTICAVAQCLCMTGCGTGVKAILYSRGEPAPFRASGTDVMLIYKAVTPVSSSDEFNGLMKFIGIITFPLNVLELPFAVCLDVVTLPVDGIIAINNAIVENREKKTQSENTPEYGPRIANTDATADEFSVILDIVGDGEDAALWFAIVNRTNSDNTQFYEPLVNDSELYFSAPNVYGGYSYSVEKLHTLDSAATNITVGARGYYEHQIPWQRVFEMIPAEKQAQFRSAGEIRLVWKNGNLVSKPLFLNISSNQVSVIAEKHETQK